MDEKTRDALTMVQKILECQQDNLETMQKDIVELEERIERLEKNNTSECTKELRTALGNITIKRIL